MFAPHGPRRLLAASCCLAATLAFAPALIAADEPAPTPPAGISPAPTPPADAMGVVATAKLKQGGCPKGELELPEGCLTLPVLKKKISPKYPDDARRAHVNGKVIATVTIGVDGKVTGITIDTCEPPGRGFEDSTKTAVRQWMYTPATLKGRPVAVFFTVMTQYSVGDGRFPGGRPASQR